MQVMTMTVAGITKRRLPKPAHTAISASIHGTAGDRMPPDKNPHTAASNTPAVLVSSNVSVKSPVTRTRQAPSTGINMAARTSQTTFSSTPPERTGWLTCPGLRRLARGILHRTRFH